MGVAIIQIPSAIPETVRACYPTVCSQTLASAFGQSPPNIADILSAIWSALTRLVSLTLACLGIKLTNIWYSAMHTGLYSKVPCKMEKILTILISYALHAFWLYLLLLH